MVNSRAKIDTDTNEQNDSKTSSGGITAKSSSVLLKAMLYSYKTDVQTPSSGGSPVVIHEPI
jgi:hypothetical protein